MSTLMRCPVCCKKAWKEFDHPDAEIFRCQNCSHCFSDQRGRDPERYEGDYFEETHKNWFENPNIALFEYLRGLIRPYGSSASVLDVGCGRGDFLVYLKAKQDGFQLTGIDLAPLPMIEGMRLITSDIFTLSMQEKFDVIVSLAVIEHVSDVRRFVSMLKEFGHKGSTVAVMTLNEQGIIYWVAKALRRIGIFGPFNRLYSKHHIHHYTLSSLKRLMQESGLEVLSQHTHNFPLVAVDFPSKGRVLDFLQPAGVAVLFWIGRWTNRAFLQTVLCRV